MRKSAATLASVFVFMHVPAVSAAWHWPNWQEMCSGFLEHLRPVNDIGEAEIRLDYNRKTLRRGQARLVSNTTAAIHFEPDDPNDWLTSVSRASIEMTLDRYIPNWRHKGYWYFQTPRKMSLYTENSRYPMPFARDAIILMNREYAAGEVFDVWNRIELYP